jgi:hypothetical protein
MLVIPPGTAAAGRASGRPNRVRVVKAYETLSLVVMKRERIAQAVQTFRRSGHAPDRESHPVPAGRIDDHHLPVEVQQRVQARIVRRLYPSHIGYDLLII